MIRRFLVITALLVSSCASKAVTPGIYSYESENAAFYFLYPQLILLEHIESPQKLFELCILDSYDEGTHTESIVFSKAVNRPTTYRHVAITENELKVRPLGERVKVEKAGSDPLIMSPFLGTPPLICGGL